MSKLVKFRRNRKADSYGAVSNPPIGVDLVQYIAPGFAAFAATRFATRVAATQIAKRYPKAAKHAGAIASLGSFAAAWFGAHRVKMLEKYHHPIVVGSGLAAIQSLVQLYLPMLGWIVSDATPEISGAAQKSLSSPSVARMLPATMAAVAPPVSEIPAGFTQIDAAAWHSYNDSFDKGGFSDQQPAPVSPPITPDDMDLPGDSLADIMDDDNMGIFSTPGEN
jgi:hypothetical protein